MFINTHPQISGFLPKYIKIKTKITIPAEIQAYDEFIIFIKGGK